MSTSRRRRGLDHRCWRRIRGRLGWRRWRRKPSIRRHDLSGLSPQQLELLCDHVADQVGTWQPPRGRHRTLDLAAAVTMTLVWLRHNLPQALLGAFDDISQPTVSRIITRLRELIARTANQGMPGMAETEPGERLLLDGSLLPTGNRAGQQGQDLYSGKRHKAGMNVQVIG